MLILIPHPFGWFELNKTCQELQATQVPEVDEYYKEAHGLKSNIIDISNRNQVYFDFRRTFYQEEGSSLSAIITSFNLLF